MTTCALELKKGIVLTSDWCKIFYEKHIGSLSCRGLLDEVVVIFFFLVSDTGSPGIIRNNKMSGPILDSFEDGNEIG